MDDQTYRVLEFNKILQMSALFAITEPGRTVVQEIRPLNNIERIKHNTALVSECRKLMSEGRSFGIEHFGDLSPLFQRIRPDDAVLDTFAMRSILALFYSALNLKILSHDPSCPGISTVVSRLVTHPEIKSKIENSIDREGKLIDGASPALFQIRRNIKSCERRIKGILEEILNKKDLTPHLQDFYLAERNKRWVIPVKIDSKGSVPGIIHDVSNTGETVYIEPFSIQHIGNELESHRAEEKLEEYRILRNLSALLREKLPEIVEDYNIVARIDGLQALAKFSEQMNMSSPEINDKGYMRITGGRHPLLWKTLKSENREKDMVPLDLDIGKDHPCMIITGSNAGGKTVALKTVGVLSLMALSGMHVPAGSGTSFPYFRRILADIGDEQSIEDNLSTFSAHVTRLSEIVQRSGSDTLVIIDELGTGTDPEQGGALSCAILRRLKKQGALSVASTHLGMLKVFAHAEQGMINSAMEMEEVVANDVSTYKPTYKLAIGEPGTSHSFEIAGSLGLHPDLIREAREFLSGEDAASESFISELKDKTREMNRRLQETEHVKQEIVHLRSKLEMELSEIESIKENTISQALIEAEEIVRKTRGEAMDIIQSLKKAPPVERREAVRKLHRKNMEINELKKLHSHEKLDAIKHVKEGQHVYIKMMDKHGIVTSVNEKARRCRVLVEGREILISFTGLYEPEEDLASSPVTALKHDRTRTPAMIEVDSVIEEELNVIGQRVDPALSLIERYLNDAAVSGLKQIKIIHGIGTGTLSSAIKDFLKDHPLVESSRNGSEDEGGEAVTVVML